MERLGGDTGSGGGDGTDGDVDRRAPEHGRRGGSWNPMTAGAQEIQMLRRPHQLSTMLQSSAGTKGGRSEESKGNKSLEDIVMNSTLSVDAAEFVPKNYSANQQRFYKPTVQDRIQRARESSHHIGPAQNYRGMPQDYAQEQYDAASGDFKDRHQGATGNEDSRALDHNSTSQQLLNVIHLLILTPGRFSSVVPAVVKSLRSYLKYPIQFRELIAIIIQQSVNEVNFRYSGARLCNFFDSNIALHEQTTFRDILYSLCKEEMENQATSWQQKAEHTEEEQRKCHGLILFLAELVTQMQDTPSYRLGELLIQLITTVLKNPAPNSVKHICQALKLAGQTLEKDKRGTREDMENMMRALTQLVTESRVDSHVGRMVTSIHELRNGNWGQSSSTTTPATTIESTVESHPYLPDGPVFYGPDGQILSPEENQFLENLTESSAPSEEQVSGEDDYGGLSDEEDMVEAAYEEFLEILKNKV